ncbi:endo-beta-glucanase [Pleurotus eryngii]|uniref:Endo-beta-glucanase n=1 Tax=Pleurotus eryngii TaxID=5323 RepID=A0A9P5ZMT8_PLEER|nr:endo-beta-glucanase [Pleurotus eryngii]
MKFLNLLILVLPVRFAFAATYNLVDKILGTAFLTAFNFQAISDPTHGRVNYVDASTAQRLNLTYAAGDTFILRADSKTVLDPNGPGRNSVRIQSKKTYTTHVSVYNIRHMPQGCGTWPAVWENGPNWPNGGEVDVLEGVNDKGPNQVTLHTSSGCSMPASRSQTGTPAQNDCNVAVNSNAGCGVKMSDSRSYGPAFNSNGGGWYAVERTSTFIKAWFWPRNAGNVPADVKNGQTVVNTGSWGTPSAYFPNTQCDIASHFKAHNIIINLTFCGDWAGSAYPSSGCPSSCVDFVNKNPGSFSNAFFDFASLRVYT